MNGQTLPSANYLRDDIQYFPAGPEFRLHNQERALKEYRAQQAGIETDLVPDMTTPPAPTPALE
jgi:hypothetical protein